MLPKRLLPVLAIFTTGSIVGVATQQIATADVSSGDRPVLIPIEPCRLIDTRPNGIGGPRSSPLASGETAIFDVAGIGTDCAGAIPADALSISTNITALNATARTFITAWAGGDRPIVSSLNPSPGQPPTPNAVSIELTAAGLFNLYNDAGSVDLFIDVNGYSVGHDHDDRYYTEAEVEALVDAASPEVVIPEPVISDFFEFDFVPEAYLSASTEQDFTTSKPGRLKIEVYMGARITCSGVDDHIYMIEIDGVVVENSAYLVRDDAITVDHRLAGITDTVVPAGDHTMRIGVECSRPSSTATVNSSLLFRQSSVIVLPE